MCALVPRGQTRWRLGHVCVGAQRPDYRWRLGRVCVGAQRPDMLEAGCSRVAQIVRQRADPSGPGQSL